MAKNFVQEGDVLTLPAPYDVVSGAGLKIGAAIFGVALNSALSGADVSFKRRGVFKGVAKATGAAWSRGDIIYWDDAAKVFTKTNTGNLRVGAAFADAASGDATGSVVLGTFVVA